MRKSITYLIIRGELTQELNTFVVAQKVRRSVDAGTVVGGSQNAIEHRGGRAFAVGSGYSDDFGATEIDTHPLRN